MASISFSNLLASVTLPGTNSWRERARRLTKSLPLFLTWETPTNVLPGSSILYQTWVDHRLSLWSRASGINFTDHVRRLPDASRRRLLAAPQLFSLLHATTEPKSERLEQLQTYLQIEEYLSGLADTAPSKRWTALGDHMISFDGTALQPLSLPKSSFVCGILLDGSSPYVKSAWINPSLGDAQEHTQEEFDCVRQNVEQAFEHVELVSQTAAQMLQSCVSVIVVAKGSKDQVSQSSMSARRMAGSMTLANLHSIESFDLEAHVGPAARIADSLVHEAIHSLTFRLELFDSFYTDEGLLSTAKIVSPWSGRELTLHSFVDACFVWFGLWNFWRISAKKNFPCFYLAQRAESGFLRENLRDIFTQETATLVQPHVYDAMTNMFETVKASSLTTKFA